MASARPRVATFGTGFLGGIAIFCAFAVVAWIFFRFTAPSETYEDKRRENREAKLAAIRQEEQQKLYSPAKWIDKTKGTVQLPIDFAMELVVNQYQAKPVQPSQVKVDDPYPYGLQSPAAAAAAAKPAANAPNVKSMAGASTVVAAGSPAAIASPSPVLHVPAANASPAPAKAKPASSPEVKP